MQHLCGKHCELVQHSSQQAVQLWHGAFGHGVSAWEAERWQEARIFLGTAYEISLLRFALDSRRGRLSLTAEQFGAVGRYYSNVLCQLGQHDEAELCLRRVHDGLLHWAQENRLPRSERMSAYEQLDEFRQRLSALYSFTGRDVYAKCHNLMALQLGHQAASGLFH